MRAKWPIRAGLESESSKLDCQRLTGSEPVSRPDWERVVVQCSIIVARARAA